MKNKFKKIIKIVVIVMVSLILLPFVAYGIMLLTVPISRSDEGVYSYVYKKIPVGTSWDEVLEIIDDKGWEIKELHTDYGYVFIMKQRLFLQLMMNWLAVKNLFLKVGLLV